MVPLNQSSAPLIFALLLLLGSWSITLDFEQDEPLDEVQQTPSHAGAKYSLGDVDVPVLYVGDSWTYDGFFDIVEMIESSGVETTAEALSGELEMRVDEITTWTVDEHSSVAYVINANGTFFTENVTLGDRVGDIIVEYESSELIRAGDFALINNEVYMNVIFKYGGVLSIPVAEITVTDTYYPPREDYDFPLRVGEEWTNEYVDVNEWVGSSGYFTIPEDEWIYANISHAVVSVGNPAVNFSGCDNSYNVTAFDENESVESFRWWCPTAKNDAWRHFENALGMHVDFYLKDFQPVIPDINYEVDLEFSTWALNTPLDVWVNVSDANGNMLPNQTFVLRYEYNDVWITMSTASNGTAYTELDTAAPLDTTPSNHDYASHGIIAWDPVGRNIGVDTLTLDAELVELDYRPRPGGISVVRVRGNDTLTLNPIYGFNGMVGDVLHFTVPIDNKGMNGGPATELEMIAPDSSSERMNIEALPPVGEQTLQFSWTVPQSQPLGLTNFSFEVDPNGTMTADVNQSNDMVLFPIFFGVYPVVNLTNAPLTYTLTEIMLDATGSSDGDGGSLHCTFEVEVDENQFKIFEESDCQMPISWPDDGNFSVGLIITDEENDQDATSTVIQILNRAPWINITSPSESLPAESSITFDAFDSGDADTLDSDAPIDAFWYPPKRSDGVQYECEEGPITMHCTVTPMEEGIFLMELVATDDDKETTTAQFPLQVTNIAPRDIVMSMSGGTADNDEPAPATWQVNEDQEVTLKGEGIDTMNDQNSLTWNWKPSAKTNVTWQESTTGADSEIQVTWTESGSHHVELEAVDDNGAGSGVITGFVTVNNVPPTSEPFTAQLPVGEDRQFQLTGIFSDTPSDVNSLQVCWDVDLTNDADDNLVNFDDCDYVGASISHAWPSAGVYTIRFHVTDDDGDVAESLVNVTVVNLRPKAATLAEKTSVAVGEEVVIWTNETSDTESDLSLLIFSWDLDTTTDSNGDGDAANDIDMLTSRTSPLRHTFDTPGTKHIRLIVTDEGYSSTSDVTIEVTGGGGFLGVMGETAGISNLLIVLVVIIGALVAVGVTLGKKSTDAINLSEDESLSDWQDEAASDAASDEQEEE